MRRAKSEAWQRFAAAALEAEQLRHCFECLATNAHQDTWDNMCPTDDAMIAADYADAMCAEMQRRDKEDEPKMPGETIAWEATDD